MRILMLTRYGCLGASSRVRSLYYLPYFKSLGWSIDVAPLFSDVYIEKLYSIQSRWKETLLAYIGRIRAMVGVGAYDLLWIEKELFPFLPAMAECLLKRLKIPYIVDYDDALFHRYDKHSWPIVRALLGRKIDVVMRYSSLVVAGNEYLAQRARSAGARHVEIVPTVIDLERYAVCSGKKKVGAPLVVGWIGTPNTSRYLHSLKHVFKSLKTEFDVRFVAIGASRESLGDLNVEPWAWSEGTEVSSIQRFDVGIMPLEDSDWERGKCGYKLIQYMACGLPVIASPVGVNSEIVEQGVNGLLADGYGDWRHCLSVLLNDADMRRDLGQAGRKKN